MKKEKNKTYTKWEIMEALSGALRDAYMKTIKGWEARIFSGNFNQFIEDRLFKYLEKKK